MRARRKYRHRVTVSFDFTDARSKRIRQQARARGWKPGLLDWGEGSFRKIKLKATTASVTPPAPPDDCTVLKNSRRLK